jgi:large subunit ribosomal protein L1
MAEAKEVESKKVKVASSKGAQSEERKAKSAETTAETGTISPVTASSESPEAKTTAKAGKRSAKARKETEAKQAKEERKTEAHSEAVEKPKAKPAPKTRSRLERQGKKIREAAKQIDTSKEYGLKEALEVAIKTSPSNFDGTVEMHIRLNVDPRHADQNIRDNLVLPAGTGKTVKIAVFADADDVIKAKQAGADITGIEEITSKLDKNQIEFDVLIATPSQMANLGKYARLLGPRGLMPNPKSGTVTPDVAKAVSEAKAGRVEYRVDSTGIVHLGIGKVSFGAKKLEDNANAVMASIKAAKPASVKGVYVKSAFVTTTMGPSVRLNPNL